MKYIILPPHVGQNETIDLLQKSAKFSSYQDAREKVLMLLYILYVKENTWMLCSLIQLFLVEQVEYLLKRLLLPRTTLDFVAFAGS